MATWVAHFRLAEGLLARGFALDRQAFLVGNIAPDSGIMTADKTGYEPPTRLSHWENAHKDIQAEKFYAEQVARYKLDASEYAFRLGYYCHLITDQLWRVNIWRPKKQLTLYREPLSKDPQFVWEIKKDWYGLDFLYLQENPDSIFFTDFVQIDTAPDYLPTIFPTGAFTRRVQETKDFYLHSPEWDLDRPYVYLNRAEWDDFIEQTLVALVAALREKGVALSAAHK